MRFNQWFPKGSQTRSCNEPMLIYLLRHADAESYASSDAQRLLTPKGLNQAAKVGQFCRAHELAPALILASPYERTRQTAGLVLSELGDFQTTLEIAPFMASGMEPETALHELRGYSSLPSVMLVGHEPDLSHLASFLLGSPAQCIHVRKASLTLIEAGSLRQGAGVLHFSIPVELMYP